jgi:hypothetical protein
MNPRTVVVIILICLATTVLQTSAEISHAQTGTSVLTVTSGLPNQGGMNPLAGVGVILLRESFGSLLRKSGRFGGQPSALRAWHTACVNRSPLCQQPQSQVEAATVAEGQMDGTGRVVLPGVDPGSYYLFAFGLSVQTAQTLIWDFRIDLKAGENSITLDQSNVAALDIRAAKQVPAPVTTTAAASAPSATVRPSGPSNSVLTLSATDGPGKPVAQHTFYLLDDDFEQILRSVGFKQQMLLGKPLPLLNSFEFVARMVALQENDPRFKLLEGFGGESLIPPAVKQQYDLGLQALSQHIVATIRTNAGGRGAAPAVPAGIYYVYGTTSEFVHVGDVVTVDRSTVSPTATNRRQYGYDSATIWNMKISLKAGQNSVILTRTNATFVTGR